MDKNLSNAFEGCEVIISCVDGDEHCVKRLNDLGILQNEKVSIIKNDKKTPLVIKVKGSKLIIGRDISRSIKIEA